CQSPSLLNPLLCLRTLVSLRWFSIRTSHHELLFLLLSVRAFGPAVRNPNIQRERRISSTETGALRLLLRQSRMQLSMRFACLLLCCAFQSSYCSACDEACNAGCCSLFLVDE